MKIKRTIAVLLTAAFVYIAGAQTDSNDWQAKAIEKYPDLGTRGSDLNTRYVAAYNERRKTDPEFFTNPAWPVVLADELAASAGSDHRSPTSTSQFKWPTTDQIGQYLLGAVIVVVLLVLEVIGVLIATNWNTAKLVFRLGFKLYKVFFVASLHPINRTLNHAL